MKITNVKKDATYWYIFSDDDRVYVQRHRLLSASETPLYWYEEVMNALCEQFPVPQPENPNA